MKALRRNETGLALTLAWLGVGFTIAATAFTVRPARASPLIFWIVILLGSSAVGMGCFSRLRLRGPSKELVAWECRRMYAAIASLIAEQERRRPRPSRFSSDQDRLDGWLAETANRYEHELRAWATKVFDQAVRAGVVSEASRPLLDARSLFQLVTLRNLFRDAGESLEYV